MKRFLILLLALTVYGVSRNSAAEAQTESLVGNDTKYYCESDFDDEFDELFGTLHRISNDRAIRFAKALRNSNDALRALKLEIRSDSRMGLATTTKKQQRNVLKTEIADIRACRDDGGTGKSRESGGGGNSSPGLACSVVGDASSASTRIVGGGVCSIGSSGVVYILTSTRQGVPDSSCTGTVVRVPGASGARHVIFAAHCTEGAGFVDINTPSGTMRATTFHKNPAWNEGQDITEDGDVAIATFSSDIPTSSLLVLGDNNFTNGETAIIGGYGLDEQGNAAETRLKAGTATLASFSAYGLTINYDGSSGANTCNGDSGGPFFVERSGSWVLGGVTSNGILEKCGPGDVSNFSNLTDPAVKSFINGIAPGVIP